MNIPLEINNFLHQYFDKVLVVSLPRFTYRHTKLQQNLQGLHFDFFWGVDKQALNIETMKTEGTYDEQKAMQLQRQGKALNDGEIACSLSHRNIYEAMINNNWKKVLVFEDDVLPAYDVLHLLPVALKELPADWELVYLGYLKYEKVTLGLKFKQLFYKLLSKAGLLKWNTIMVNNMLPKIYSRHLKKAGFHDCTHAYALTLEAAKKLFEAQVPVAYRADDLLSNMNMKGQIKTFVTTPKFFDQEVFHNHSLTSEIR